MYPAADVSDTQASTIDSHRGRPLMRGGLSAVFLAAIVAAALFALAAAPLSFAKDGQSGAAAGVVVHIDSALHPAALTIAPGTVVTFHNGDDERHRMRTHSDPAKFDTGNLKPGESSSIRFTVQGTYQYFDHRSGHSHTGGYVGTIIVQPGAPPPSGGGGGGTPPPSATPPPTTASVGMANSAFSPRAVTIAVGGTVTWTNDDDRPHTVTAGDRSFDSSTMARGATFQRTFMTAGTYSYVCDFHSDMTGTVIVVAAGGTTPPPPPAPPTTPPPSTPPPSTPPPSTPPPTTPPPTTPPPVTPPATVPVGMANSAFSPRTVTIAEGGTVTWTNDDDRPHTVTAGDGSFDSGILARGATFSRTFPTAGTFAYECILHSGMTGTATVVASGRTPPPSPPPPTTPPPTTPPPATPPPAPPPPTTPPSTTPPPATPPSSVTVGMAGSAFSPQALTVAAGGTVTWNNNDTLPHTVTAGDGSFDSGILAKGATFSRPFPTAGTFAYECILHSGMTGTVTVVAGGGTPPSAGSGSATPPPSQTPASQPPATPAPATPAPATQPPSTPSTGTPPPATATVGMSGSTFSPRTATVAVGGTVTWKNDDTLPHTVTAADKSFDSSIIMKGGTFVRAFPAAGTYAYECILHPGMTGTVVVTNSASTAAAATSATTAASTKTTPITKKKATKKAKRSVATKVAKRASVTTRAAKTSVGGSSTAAAPATASVSMKGSVFTPKTATIRPGGTVTWTNDDTLPHTVTADDGSYDSGMMAKGATFTRTYPTAGTYTYKCILHPGMVGTVVVKESSGGAATAAPKTSASAAGTAHTTTSASPVSAAPSTATTPAPAAKAPAAAGSKNSATVDMRDNTFSPASLTVSVGTVVTFTNSGKLPHTVTAKDKSFDSGLVSPGGKWTTTFTKVGTFAYDCILHPGMTGTVTVVAADEATPTDDDSAAAPPSSGTGAHDSMGTAPAVVARGAGADYRGVALLVAGLVIAGGVAYLLGLLIVQEPRVRRIATRIALGFVGFWWAILDHVIHPFHPRAMRVRVRTP